jgi:hypothetical protein
MPTILGANSVRETGYNVDNSLRFESGDSDNLSRTNVSSVTNQFKWTFSFWVKLSDLFASRDGNPFLLSDFTDSNNRAAIFFESDNTLRIADRVSGSFTFEYRTHRKFRDTSAWYHIVVNHDRTISSPSTEIYVNGVQETEFSANTNPSQNGTSFFNKASQSSLIGKYGGGNEFFNGYICEAVWIDGQALDATSFGEFDEDSPTHWKPKDVSSLTFGNNGFYLDFEDSSSLGKDVSGNSNNFTVNNITALNQTTDTCTNNFCTHNLLIDGDTGYSEGCLDLSFAVDGTQLNAGGTIGFSSGKWYWEHKIISSGNTHYLGIKSADSNLESTSGSSGSPSMYYTNGGKKVYNASSGGSSYGNTFSNNDIIGVAVDLDNNAIWFSKNGTWQNSATQTEVENGTTTNAAFSGTSSSDGFPSSQIYLPWIVGQKGGSPFTMTTNFGNPTFSISSGNSDSEGFGNFEYAVPSGFFAICTKNLAEYGG